MEIQKIYGWLAQKIGSYFVPDWYQKIWNYGYSVFRRITNLQDFRQLCNDAKKSKLWHALIKSDQI